MNEIERIIDQLNSDFDGDAWTGPSIMEVLSDINSLKAASKPIQNAHSIWEITKHMNSAIMYVIRRMEGDNSELTPKEDWPDITDTGKQAWEDLINRLRISHLKLISEIAKLMPEQLNEPVFENDFSYFVLLQGLIQHNQYHLGQISILKKGYFSTEGMLSH